MRLVHRERWWSWAATAGVVTVGLAWSADPPTSPWVAVAYWVGFTTAMIGVAATYKAYGRRTAPPCDRATFKQGMLDEVTAVLLTEAIVWRAHNTDNGVDRAAQYETAAAFLRYTYDPQNAPYYDRELPG